MTSEGPRRTHRKHIRIAELRIDAFVFGSNRQAPNSGLHAGTICKPRVPRPLRRDRTALRVDLIEPARAAVESIDVGMEPRRARLAVDVKEWKRQRQVSHTEGRDRARMRVRAIVVTVVTAVAAGMTEIDVLEFRAEDGNWPNAGNRLPRKMVPGIVRSRRSHNQSRRGNCCRFGPSIRRGRLPHKIREGSPRWPAPTPCTRRQQFPTPPLTICSSVSPVVTAI